MPTEPRPQIPYTVTFQCGHTADRKSRLATPEYIASKQRKAAAMLCPACRAEKERADRERAEAKQDARDAAILSQLPPDATDLEKVVYLEGVLNHPVYAVVSSEPFYAAEGEDDPGNENVIEIVIGIRKRTAENRLRSLQQQYPDAHIALYTAETSADSRPLYVYS